MKVPWVFGDVQSYLIVLVSTRALYKNGKAGVWLGGRVGWVCWVCVCGWQVVCRTMGDPLLCEPLRKVVRPSGVHDPNAGHLAPNTQTQ